MNLSVFMSMLLLLCGSYSNGASIGDGVAVEELEAAQEELAPAQGELEVLQSEPVIVPDEIIKLESEQPKLAQLVNEEVPSDATGDIEQEAFPVDVVPVLAEQENCEIPKDVVDEESAVRAERQADEDLLKALDNVLAKKETLEDVIKSENISLS